MKNIIQDTPASIYLMHKYWGKKPGKDLRSIVLKYSKEKNKILDPFAGFGGIAIESILNNRNVIINDLNPVANNISKIILEQNIDITKFKNIFIEIKEQYSNIQKFWYENEDIELITTLRNSEDIPLRNRYYNKKTKKYFELDVNENDKTEFSKKEKEYNIKEWYPNISLIKNSRICVKNGMKIENLFPKRALACHAYLYDIIEKLPNSNEKDLMKFAFTSNLANCSKLVPPIKSRGQMSQGAWMTGFYIGETYLENNVFHYFENRVNKAIKGKSDYIKLLKTSKKIGNYQITNEDAKKLSIKDNSIDLVFTDFPYGDTVPYFEQSQLWNSWLNNIVDYENEIVISNSDERKKNLEQFSEDINKSVNEIYRVLKNNSYFVFTYHSLDGGEWTSLNNAISNNGFEFVNCELLLQKTFTPRQLNRKLSIKGDLIVVYKKNNKIINQTNQVDFQDLNNDKNDITLELRKICSKDELYTTNDLIIKCINLLLKKQHRTSSINFIDIIKENFEINNENNDMWGLK